MDNRFIGFAIILASVILMVPFGMDAALAFNPSVIVVSFLWVVGLASGLTIMEREVHVAKFFTDFSKNLVFAGYMGAMIIMVVFLNQATQINWIEKLTGGVSLALVNIFLGYFLSHILGPFFKHRIQ